jgi:pimeloyl-ACP methyl ester carboxylesterase
MHLCHKFLSKRSHAFLYIFFLCFHLNVFSQQINQDTSQFKFALPTPSGKYNIGTRFFYVTDSSRFDSVLNKRGRDIVFQIWYPSVSKQKSTLSYIPEILFKAMQKDEYNNIDSISLLSWGKIKTHASENIPNDASKKFPILFFLHGFGMSRYSYITIIEDLVSHGFIVISLDSPHSGLMLLADGKIISTLYDGKPVIKCESMAKDVSFIYDWLIKSKDQKLLKLISVIDFNKAGVLGHSLGGAAALETCRIDNRFSACIDLDGDPFGKVEEVGLNKPTLILLNAPVFTDKDLPTPEVKEKWKQMGNERKKTWQDIFLKNESISAFAITINGTNHFTFTDFPFVTKQYYLNPKAGIIIDKNKGLKIISNYIQDFFARYISEDHSVSIKKLTGKFPETNLYLTTSK